MQNLNLNQSYELVKVVLEKDLASSLKIEGNEEDIYAAVLSTPVLITWMEIASAAMMIPLLHREELSVGTEVNMKHLAATPLGEQVKIISTFLGMEGKFFHFKVEAFDSAGAIGMGTHTRAIQNRDKFFSRTKKRFVKS